MTRFEIWVSCFFSSTERRRSRLYLVVAGLFLCVGISGCSRGSAVLGAGATAGTAALQERGFKTPITDTTIDAKINFVYLDNDVDFKRITIDVHEGRVLLTGSVPKPVDRIEAVRLAWTVEGVGEVINEISVRDGAGLLDAVRDRWVSAQLRLKITFDSKIHAINYTIDTVNGVVYLLGIAQDAAELRRVRNHASAMSYVRRVKSHVRIKAKS
ncbi:MAG: osmotically-inducible protein OsmY [Alphaproteobacteria bacterium]